MPSAEPTTTATDGAINLLDPDAFANGHPFDQYRWLRDNDPVHRHDEPDGPGFWAVTRYEDVKAVGKDTETFSSAPTILIPDPPPGSALTPEDHWMMLFSDPPIQTDLRRLVSADFTPRAAGSWRPRVADLARQIVDAVIEAGSCDLVEQVAGEMPSFVVADFFGLPHEVGRELYHLTEVIHSAPEVVGAEDQERAVETMFGHAGEVWARAQADPDGDDLAARLTRATIDRRPFDVVDFALFFMLVVDAGGDTTRNLVAGGMHTLFEHPDQRRWLAEDIDGRLPGAIEELLRWVSPVVYMRRTATTDTEVGGQAIAAGDKVVMYYGSANRDPAAFEEPDRLDLARTPNRHAAFGGGGAHFCLGSHLARIEIAAMLREIFTRMPDIGPAGPTEWLPSVFISGPTHLPVTFTPGGRAADGS